MADLPNLANVAAGPDYVERINRAIDHVMRHLAEPWLPDLHRLMQGQTKTLH